MKPYEPTACFACRRSAYLKQGKPAKDVCMTCSYVPGLTQLSAPQLDVYEQCAIVEAGEKAGAYLDELGRTDLAALTETEWVLFLRTFWLAAGDSIRQQIRSGKPPF